MQPRFRWFVVAALASYAVAALAYSRLGLAIDQAIDQILADG